MNKHRQHPDGFELVVFEMFTGMAGAGDFTFQFRAHTATPTVRLPLQEDAVSAAGNVDMCGRGRH